jgi:two-component system response regulator PhcR
MSETQSARPTVVYVDDEELARKYFARSAGSAYEVLLADGADEALSKPCRSCTARARACRCS